MTLRELELFYYLADNPHVSKLAKELQISQSAISLAIKSLEHKLSEPLFDRIGKKLLLNERGRRFKEETYKHFLALKDAENIFKQDKLSGVLKIASSKTIGNFIMPSLVFEFISKNPHIQIETDIKNSSQIITMVKEGSIDIGIIERTCDEKEIRKEVLGEDELVVVSSDKSVSYHDSYIDQLFSKKWLLREKGSGTRELFLEALGEMQKEFSLFMECTEFEEIKTLLFKYPDTLTCISKFAVTRELARQELFAIALINMRLTRELYIIYNKEKYQSSLFKSFYTFVKDNFKQA